jgi:hypothetical protein
MRSVGQLQIGVGVNSGVDAFFTGVGVELELNLLVDRWSWSGVGSIRSGAEVELELNLLSDRWSWSGVQPTWSGVGVDAFYQLRFNSC